MTSAFTNAQMTEAGWQVGDVYGLDAFCFSEKAGLNLMNLMNLHQGKVPYAPTGCVQFARSLPFVLQEELHSMLDWEGDNFTLWRVREFFRTDIYVLLWDRPEITIPKQFRSI